MIAIYSIGFINLFDMATKDFFTLIREGDNRKIQECVESLRDLTAIDNALNLNPSLVRLVNEVRRFRQAR